MSISRVKPNGWYYISTLTSDQANQLDTNATYGIDKRDGYSDSVYSDITFASGSSLTFASGSALTINDPTQVTIVGDTELEIDCVLRGDTKPIRVGIGTSNITSTSHTVPASVYRYGIIHLTGTLTDKTTVYLPAVSGYSKVIWNETSGDYQLYITTAASGATGVTIPPGCNCEVLCDGTDIHLMAQEPKNVIVGMWMNNSRGNTYGDTLYGTTNTDWTSIGDYTYTFNNVKQGDIFEITFQVGLSSANAVGLCHFRIDQDEDAGVMDETNFFNTGVTQKNYQCVCYYVAQNDQTSLEFTADYKSSSISYSAYIKHPMSLIIKQIRP